ncbi:EAL domain-containing protein [Rhizobium sp. MHM7A]|uniref:putative bifunctional diguanylate cyclase/phosphodiesterase n=1 Tax=Rhizobium sp. MHM7A TaxID=2583233 RepID=UPI00110755DE|nr:EAL domain-containing protein [Rhizobium sp. MHM7A]TLX16193.1 EAL domain-containing protein [Rhizobium sp. MHM7A]
MIDVLSCLSGGHDPLRLSFSILIVVLGSLLTMNIFETTRSARGGRLVIWSGYSGLIGGSTVWATHFMAMVAFDPGLKYAFDPTLTILSSIAAILAVSAGMFLAAVLHNGVASIVGGVIMAAGIVLMHFTGMAGYLVEGTIVHQAMAKLIAMALGAAFSVACLYVLASGRNRKTIYISGLFFVLAICSVHFVSMSGIVIEPDPTIVVPMQGLSEENLTRLVMVAVIVVLMLGLMTYMLDYFRNREEVVRYRFMAHHDQLTLLPNRTFLIEKAREFLPEDGSGGRCAVYSFDFNRFKDINDVHGHAAGDRVLQTVATGLQTLMNENVIVVRIGGDEFVALQKNVKNENSVHEFVRELRDHITKDIQWEGRALNVGTSIGVALYPKDGHGLDELLIKADLAMYRGKREPQISVAFYDEQLDEANRYKSALAIDLRHAISNGEFQLLFQPQNRVDDRSLIGFEVLLRWQHPERGLIMPDVFIPLAERDGYVNVIGAWVLEEACRQAASWAVPRKVAVNVASSQLSGDKLPSIVKGALDKSGLAPHLLEIEITESGIINDFSHALEIVRAVKALGVNIAMDDFGTGYSSLSALRIFPFDKIKIDKTFVSGLIDDQQSQAIVKTAITLGRSLNITVLAEGVETEAHLDFLRNEGCTEVQGFLFGKPSSNGGGTNLAVVEGA